MSTQPNQFNLSEPEIKQLNDLHIGGVDKRMHLFMGPASKSTKV